MVLLYSILNGKTIDVGKIILREMQNCAIRRSGLAYFPSTITILCLKAKILTNVKKTGYSEIPITDWDLYQIAGESVLQQRVQESEDPEEEEKDPTMQLAEVPDLRYELSKLIDIMQHMQWQQQAYWKYSKIRDEPMRSAFKKIYNDPFIFVPEFRFYI
ncbi:hypothetical protein PVK06_019582 [Gossypium arboreum]|uniref:Uncharacterized protein n=1 Tax=Gossypium arboreum TaxID=29729 RepID=A0ABR0PK37_GOSAR|nr:hypothetical protein PVK06_019582 [Gossypium arboreum]